MQPSSSKNKGKATEKIKHTSSSTTTTTTTTRTTSRKRDESRRADQRYDSYDAVAQSSFAAQQRMKAQSVQAYPDPGYSSPAQQLQPDVTHDYRSSSGLEVVTEHTTMMPSQPRLVTVYPQSQQPQLTEAYDTMVQRFGNMSFGQPQSPFSPLGNGYNVYNNISSINSQALPNVETQAQTQTTTQTATKGVYDKNVQIWAQIRSEFQGGQLSSIYGSGSTFKRLLKKLDERTSSQDNDLAFGPHAWDHASTPCSTFTRIARQSLAREAAHEHNRRKGAAAHDQLFIDALKTSHDLACSGQRTSEWRVTEDGYEVTCSERWHCVAHVEADHVLTGKGRGRMMPFSNAIPIKAVTAQSRLWRAQRISSRPCKDSSHQGWRGMILRTSIQSLYMNMPAGYDGSTNLAAWSQQTTRTVTLSSMMNSVVQKDGRSIYGDYAARAELARRLALRLTDSRLDPTTWTSRWYQSLHSHELVPIPPEAGYSEARAFASRVGWQAVQRHDEMVGRLICNENQACPAELPWVAIPEGYMCIGEAHIIPHSEIDRALARKTPGVIYAFDRNFQRWILPGDPELKAFYQMHIALIEEHQGRMERWYAGNGW